MTLSEINNTIALTLGWKDGYRWCGGEDRDFGSYDPNGIFHKSAPNYYTSLDACKEFELLLGDSHSSHTDYWKTGRGAYIYELYKVVSGEYVELDGDPHERGKTPKECNE